MSTHPKALKITKRALLVGGLAVGGGLVVGYAYLRDKPGTAGFGAFGVAGTALNAWVKITPEGRIILAVPRGEMGQGVYTAIAMLIAEELEVGLDQIEVEHPDVDGKYANAFILTESMPQFRPLIWLGERVAAALPLIATGGSTTIRDGWEAMRRVGASARMMLVQAAAISWDVAFDECEAKLGVVNHPKTGRSLSYGDLAEAAAQIKPPADPQLKPPSEFRLVGTPAPRIDIPAKVTGQAQFGIDVVLPGMLYAAVRQCPLRGGRLVSYDAEAVMGLPGVEAVTPVHGGVAVVAHSYWQASKALEALAVEFEDGGNGELSSKSISALYHEAMDSGDVICVREEGDTKRSLKTSAKTHEAIYELPFLAHTCMEPMNCTAIVKGDRVEIWLGCQSPTMANWGAAEGAGVETDKVTTHVTFMGGGFGRRQEVDISRQAAQIARAVEGRPVKLIWSREEDVQHDSYRPAVLAKFQAGLDESGSLTAWTNRLVLQSVDVGYGQRNLPALLVGDGSDDMSMTQGADDLPYALPHLTVEKVVMDLPVDVGYWRSVGHSYNGFFTESFIDELAALSKQDPYAYRRGLLRQAPRHLQVLNILAEKAGWEIPLAAGRGRGMALHESFGSVVGQVAEISLSAQGELSVDRVICVVDCGMTVNPDTIVAQMQSGIVYGLSAALYGEITLEAGQIVQSNFPDYEALKLAAMPAIETYIVPSTDYPGGVGEPGTPPIAPALTNALFNATGKRIRKLPLKNLDFLSL